MEKANKTPKPISQLNYDHEVSIATASSRMAKQWKNETLSVLDFVQRLQKNVVTKETIDEYLAFPKSEQDTIKDVGAFVGGTLKGGRRRKEDVANRSLLTFDLDYGNRKTIDKIKKHFKNFCFTVYSTHKHTTHKPRLRLILYPDRVMLPDEFQAAMRKLGEKIDMDSIDDGSYDVNRLFYWPSSSADGDVVFYHNDKPFVQVDDVLSEYGKDEAWKDVTLWPTSSRESKKLKQLLSKQADPLTKPGFVGAFCRVISIRDAIEKHLEGTYKKEGKDRYTYTDGTSTNGLVVYDEKFAYSNHDSDPSSGQLCNAFDLIRIHQFGHEDANAKAGTPANRMPSFTAMMEWCHTLDGVKEELVKGSIDPAEFDVFDEEDGGKWLAKLQTRNTGEVKPTFFNAVHIMKHDPQLKERMKWNEFSYGMEKMDGTPWENEDSFNVREYIGSVYAADFPENKIEHAMQNQALVNSYHPVQNYLKAWSGTDRNGLKRCSSIISAFRTISMSVKRPRAGSRRRSTAYLTRGSSSTHRSLFPERRGSGRRASYGSWDCGSGTGNCPRSTRRSRWRKFSVSGSSRFPKWAPPTSRSWRLKSLSCRLAIPAPGWPTSGEPLTTSASACSSAAPTRANT